jgi:hypothetical protein
MTRGYKALELDLRDFLDALQTSAGMVSFHGFVFVDSKKYHLMTTSICAANPCAASCVTLMMVSLSHSSIY